MVNPIDTRTTVRLNPQMETERALALKLAGGSGLWGVLAEWCEEADVLCSADCNDLLINNTFQPLV